MLSTVRWTLAPEASKYSRVHTHELILFLTLLHLLIDVCLDFRCVRLLRVPKVTVVAASAWTARPPDRPRSVRALGDCY
eukprot:1731818-Pleurochrysis_carterae.AAC.1